jgi:hypothetical protein
MSKTLKAVTFALFIALIGLGCFGGYRLYQRRYLSSDMKRTLTAAMDPAASENDVVTYIRDARLQVHTERDIAILEKFETCMQLAKDASEIEQRLWKETLDSLSALGSRSEYRWPEKQAYDLKLEKLAKDEAGTAQKLYKEVRAELGLPPLPSVEARPKGK